MKTEQRKDLSRYINLPYTIQLHASPEGGYAAGIVELPGCISQGDTAQEALEMVRDAMEIWISSALEDGESIPEPSATEYSGKFLLRLPKSLHRDLAERATREGVSLNQFILYQLSCIPSRRLSPRES